MPNTDDLEDDEDNQGQEKVVQIARKHLRALEKKAQGFDDAEAKATKLERQLAFKDAGVPSSKLGEMFTKAYDGEVTPDAIKVAWQEISGDTTSVSDEEKDAHQRVAEATKGQQAPPGKEDLDSEMEAIDWRDPKAQEKIMALAAKRGRVKGVNVFE